MNIRTSCKLILFVFIAIPYFSFSHPVLAAIGDPCTVSTTGAEGTTQTSRTGKGTYCRANNQDFSTGYELLAPIPLEGGSFETSKTTTSTYIQGLFKLIIGIAGALAVIMIIYGGIQYMSTDAFSGKSLAKATIENAVWGLLLAIGAWLILYTVNPELVKINFDIEPQEVTGTLPGLPGFTDTSPTTPTPKGGKGSLPGYNLTPEQIAQNAQIRANLLAHTPSVKVNSGPCISGEIEGCTNLVNLPQRAIEGVKNLATLCLGGLGLDCEVVITGGAEGGHVTHGPNLPRVDLRRNLNVNKYIEKEGTKIEPRTKECSRIGDQYRLGGAIYVHEGNHWHVCY